MSETVAPITTIVSVKLKNGAFNLHKISVADCYPVVEYPIETSKWQGNSLVSNPLECANCSKIGEVLLFNNM